MVAAPGSKQPPTKAAVDRRALRAQGLRPIELWVPDVDAPAFRSEAHRQSALVAAADDAADDQSFIDSIAALDDE